MSITCRLIGVDQRKSFKQQRDTTSNGLGAAYYYDSGKGKYLPVSQFDLASISSNDYDPRDLHAHGKYAGSTLMGFGWPDPPKGSGHGSTITVTWLEQSDAAATAWGDFIPKTSSFTDVGITKINESIRAYVYALLGAQAQTKTSVLTEGTGLDAQQQFITIVESLINAEPDLEQSIDQFQDSLQYAKTPLNFVVKPGLYLVPSDMDLRVGVHDGYNNNLQIAPPNAQTGFQPTINSQAPALESDDFDSEPTREPPSLPPTLPPSLPRDAKTPLEEHDDEKLAMTVGAVAIGAMGLLAYKALT